MPGNLRDGYHRKENSDRERTVMNLIKLIKVAVKYGYFFGHLLKNDEIKEKNNQLKLL